MRTYVKSDIYPHEPEVAPVMSPEYVRVRLEELVCGSVRTELAIIRGARVRDVTTCRADKLTQVLLTSLCQGWPDSNIFYGGAGDLGVAKC